jgi:ketosteroid isomerase-like protein
MDMRVVAVIGSFVSGSVIGCAAVQPETRASRAESEAIVHEYLKAWDTGDPALFERVLTPDFADYMYGQRRSREALILQASDKTYTSRRNMIEDTIVEGDKIVVRISSEFTHAATGKQLKRTGIIIVRVEEGRITEGWGEHDRLGTLQQLGLLPEGKELTNWIAERLQRK